MIRDVIRKSGAGVFLTQEDNNNWNKVEIHRRPAHVHKGNRQRLRTNYVFNEEGKFHQHNHLQGVGGRGNMDNQRHQCVHGRERKGQIRTSRMCVQQIPGTNWRRVRICPLYKPNKEYTWANICIFWPHKKPHKEKWCKGTAGSSWQTLDKGN